MDKSWNNLLKMPFTLRNLIVFRRRLTDYNVQTFLSYSSAKETESKSILIDLGDNPSAILNYIDKNQDSLTGENCVEALRKLSQCYPESSRRSKQLADKKDLLVLCNELDKRTKTLVSSQAVEAIELLSELGISPKSIIFQSLLKNIQINFNSLADQEASVLKRILSKLKKSDLTDTMKIILSKISQSNHENINLDIIPLCDRLYKATREKCLDRNIVNTMLDGISKYPYAISVLTAKSIFVSSSKIPEIVLTQYPDLLKKIQYNLINEAHTFQYHSVVQILRAMKDVQRGNNFGEKFYNEQLIDSMINNLLSKNNLKLGEGITLLIELRFLGHLQKPLIDYLALKCFDKPTLISLMKIFELKQFLSGLTVSNYKPPFWESMQQLIVDNEHLKSCPEYTLIRILCNLAIMESFPHNLISRAFQLKKIQLRDINFAAIQRFGLLYQLVKTLDPNYFGPWPSEAVLNNIFNVLLYTPLRLQTYPLLSVLEKALGGSEYIKTGVRTKLGHFIDHVIVMRKGAFPTAINQGESKGDYSNYEKKSIPFVEDIIVPPESQVIAVLNLESGAYLRNLKQPRGHIHASIKSLEALKYIVIPIYQPEWIKLHERDKIPFIMKQIRLKCPPDSISVII